MLLCDDVNCGNVSHKAEIDLMYNSVLDCLADASQDLMSTCNNLISQLLVGMSIEESPMLRLEMLF